MLGVNGDEIPANEDEYVCDIRTSDGKRYASALRLRHGYPEYAARLAEYVEFQTERARHLGLPPLNWTKNGETFTPGRPEAT